MGKYKKGAGSWDTSVESFIFVAQDTTLLGVRTPASVQLHSLSQKPLSTDLIQIHTKCYINCMGKSYNTLGEKSEKYKMCTI